MPLKDKGEYNNYMRQKMREKYWRDKGMSEAEIQKKREEFAQKEANKLEIQQEQKEVFVDGLRDLLGEDLPKDDPLFKSVDKYGRYVPVVLKFLDGFLGRVREAKAEQEQQQEQQVIPQKPAGYGTIEALRYKDNPAYQRQVEMWEAYLANGNQPINITKTPSDYKPQKSNVYGQPTNQEPRSLAELEKKYADPPVISQQPPAEPQQAPPKPQNEEKKPEQVEEQTKVEKLPEEAATEIAQQAQMQMVHAEINEKIEMVVNYLNSMTTEEFEKQVKDYEKSQKKMIAKIKMASVFMSSTLKGAILGTKPEELEILLKDKCPEKYEYLKTNKKLTKYKNFFKKIQGVLK